MFLAVVVPELVPGQVGRGDLPVAPPRTCRYSRLAKLQNPSLL